MPHMVDREYTSEDDPGSFLEPGWEEDMLEVEAFHKPPRSLTDPTNDNNHRVPLMCREQAYANHGSQVDQAIVADGDPRAATPLQPGVAHWGLRGRGLELCPPPRRTEQGAAWR